MTAKDLVALSRSRAPPSSADRSDGYGLPRGGVSGTGLRLLSHTVGTVVAMDAGSGRLLRLAMLDERDPQAVLGWLPPLLGADRRDGAGQ